MRGEYSRALGSLWQIQLEDSGQDDSFDLSHSHWYEVESQGCFDLHFSNDYRCFFRCYLAIHVSSVEKSV